MSSDTKSVASGAGVAAKVSAHLFGSFLSTPARGVMHYCAEYIPPHVVSVEDINFGGGQHQSAAYVAVNPMKKVPALAVYDAPLSGMGVVCATTASSSASSSPSASTTSSTSSTASSSSSCVQPAFCLSESSAILQYIAERWGPAATFPRPYPDATSASAAASSAAAASDASAAAYAAQLRAHARVLSVIETVHGDLSRYFPGGLCYPQLFPLGRRAHDGLHNDMMRIGARDGAKHFALFDHMLAGSAPGGGDALYLAGTVDTPTIADFYALSVLYLGVCLGADLKPFPRLAGWFGRMTATASFKAVYAPLIAWANGAVVAQQRVAKGMSADQPVTWDAKTAADALAALSVSPAVACPAKYAAAPAGGKQQLLLFATALSAPSRAVLSFVNGHAAMRAAIAVVDIDLGAAAEQRSAAYRQHVSASALVPVLVELATPTAARWALTESSAIIRYLALKFGAADDTKTGSAAAVEAPGGYPRGDIHARARVNERMAWFNSSFYSLYGYHMVFAQTTNCAAWSSTDLAQREAEWAKPHVLKELDALEHVWLRAGSGSAFLLAGNKPSAADLLGRFLMSAGAMLGCAFGDFANITRWMRAVDAAVGGAELMAPLHTWLATAKPFGDAPTTGVAVRPVLGVPYVRRVSYPLVDEAAYIAYMRDNMHRWRGIKGVRSARVELATASAYAAPGSSPRKVVTMTTVFVAKSAWVEFLLSAEFESLQKEMRATGSVDIAAAVRSEATLLDL